MSLKRIVGSHFANYREAWEANRLIDKGLVHPTLSKVYSMDEVGQAVPRHTRPVTSWNGRVAIS